VLAGLVAPPRNAKDEIAIEAMNNVLGGDFTARLNMNLREDKHWSYGAGSFLPNAAAQRPYLAYAPVETDKTKESVAEILKEMREIPGSRPASEAELERAKDLATRTLPGQWETIRSVASSMDEILRYRLPDDYFTTYPDKVRALGVGDLATAAKTMIAADNLVWVVVGDRAKIAEGLGSLGLGTIQELDADGGVKK
jgi:zinc protease